MIGPRSLIGQRSLSAAQFRLNSQYPVGTPIASRVGYYGLGLHRTMNIGLEPNYGIPAWRDWIRKIQASMATVHTGTGAIQYTPSQISDYMCQCLFIHLQIKELHQLIKMLDWSSSETLEAMKDFWASSEATAIQARGIKSQLCNKVNAYADTFYTTYPFLIPNFMALAGELLSHVYRDDKSARTNYIYFHLFDKPWDAVLNAFDSSFTRLDTWLNPNNANYATQSVFGVMPSNVLPMIIGDMRAVFGEKCWQSIPLLLPTDAADVVYDQDLINSLNQSPTGDTQFHYTATNGAWKRIDQDIGSGWVEARPQLSDAANTWMGTGTPEWGTRIKATWTNQPSMAGAWNKLTDAVNQRGWDLPVYHAFDGPSILSEFCFTTLFSTITYENVFPTTYDPVPNFARANGAAEIRRYGLFGIYFTDAVTYTQYINGNWNLQYAQSLNFWIADTTVLASRQYCPIISSGSERTAYNLILNSRSAACQMDAITTWDFVCNFTLDQFLVFSDEDIDEWSILPTVDLISNYGATAQGMFESDAAVVAQSNRVTNVSLSPKNAGYVKSKGNFRTNNDRRGGRGRGKNR